MDTQELIIDEINPGMTLVSEFQGDHRRAEVWKRDTYNDWMAVGYQQGFTRAAHPFPDEESAEDWCENWVLSEILVVGDSSTK